MLSYRDETLFRTKSIIMIRTQTYDVGALRLALTLRQDFLVANSNIKVRDNRERSIDILIRNSEERKNDHKIVSLVCFYIGS
jgi:hypothetical protein